MASGLHLSSPDAMAITRISPTMSRNLEPTVPPRCMWATKEDWIANQGLIAQLYEKHTLPKVMHLMETKYGFKATIKMYKTRVKQWGLNKKSQQHEIRAVAHQRRQRRPVIQGKRFAIRLHGQVVDVGHVNRVNKRRQLLIDDINIPRLASTSPETMLECFTAIPILSTTPWRLDISERIFKTIGDYHRGSFESGMWVSDQEGLVCRTVKAGPEGASIENPSEDVIALENHCLRACRLFDGNSYEKAGKALIAATAGIKTIVQAEHPMNLSLLFGLVLNVRQWNRQEVALAILRQFSAFAAILLGDQHPLRQVCGWLASVDTTCFNEVVVRCLRNASECLENNLGPMHRSTLYSRLSYTEIACAHEGDNQAEMLQRNLLYKCERVLGAHDVRTMEARLFLAWLHLQRGNYSEAKKLGQDTVAYSNQARPQCDQYSWRASGLHTQAIAQYNLDELESAEANLREAIALRQFESGKRDSKAKYWLVVLKEWMSEQGHSSDSEASSEAGSEAGSEEGDAEGSVDTD